MGKEALRRIQFQLAFVGAVLAFVAVEVAAKTFYLGQSVRSLAKERESFLGREGALAGGLREQGHFERSLALHPFWGYGGRPGKLAVNRHGFYSGKELGLCGERLCLEGAEKGDLVVGVFGGSLALQVASDEAALEQLLAPGFPGRRVRVANFALPGHAAPQTLAAYQYVRAAVHVVVFLDGLNEIWNPAQNNSLGYPPVFAKAEHYRLLAGEAEGSRREIDRLRRQLKAATERSLLPVWNRFTLSHAVWSVERNYLLRRLAEAASPPGGDAKPFFPAGEEQLVALGVAEWEHAHRQAARTAQDTGAAFVHLLQPAAQSGKKTLSEEERSAVDTMPHLARLVRLGYPELARRAGALGVRDLSHALDFTPDTLWIDPAHLNEKGLEALRAELGRAVRESVSPRKKR